jgi:UDP-2,3-diacylglucosamine pyrophosphatase LpxH
MNLRHAIDRRLLAVARFGLVLGIACVPRVTQAESARYQFFISDTHLGVGRAANGSGWDAYEDARWASDFGAFVSYVESEGHGKADLIINGDAFELWQSRTVRCQSKNKDLGCSEQDALKRFKRVLSEHKAELERLKEFASKAGNRLVFVVGNHDAALLFPAVANELTAQFSGPQYRLTIERDGMWTSPDRLVIAEHGHEVDPGDENALSGWPQPFVKAGGIQYLNRPWGEQFVQAFYNQFEDKYPAIDNITSELTAVRIGLAAEGAFGTARDLAKFMMFVAKGESLRQFSQVLGPGGGRWDVDEERKKGAQFLLESFPPDDPLQKAFNQDKAAADAFVKNKNLMTDQDIRDICNARAAVVQNEIKSHSTPSGIHYCLGTMGSAAGALVTKRDVLIQRHLEAMEHPPTVFVFSHTHVADAFDLSGSGVHVFNTGAWQRLITPDGLKKKAGTRSLAETLQRLTPEGLDACYSFVVVGPYKDEPNAKLRSWRPRSGSASGAASDARCM